MSSTQVMEKHDAGTFHVERPSEITQSPRTRYAGLAMLLVIAAVLAGVILSLN